MCLKTAARKLYEKSNIFQFNVASKVLSTIQW